MKLLRYKYYRFIWWLAQYLPHGKFVHLDLELTNACNQSCLSCWHHDKENLPFKIETMPEFIARQYLEESRTAGAMSVKFNWRGESTLHPGLNSLIKYASELGYIDIMLNTNGVRLIESDLIKFNFSGLTTLIISVDSLNSKTYAKIHCCDQIEHKKLMTVLYTLRAMHLAGNLKYKVILNYHINKINEDEPRQAVFHIYPDKFSMFPIRFRNTMKREGEDITIEQKKKERKSFCPHMKRRLTVAANGSIYPCCVAYNEPWDLYLSNEINDALIQKRGHIKHYKKHRPESCNNCTSADIWKK